MKHVLTTILIISLISMSILTFKVRTVQASGTIYIRANGSIDPPTASISTTDSVTYTFTGNIYDSIVVERDNIIIHGAGQTLQKTGGNTGITLQGRINVTIRNAVIKGFGLGIGLYFSNNCILYGNRIDGNSSGPGIVMSDSEYNRASNNTLLNNGHSIMLGARASNNVICGNNASNNFEGISLGSSSNNNTVANNTANNNSGDGILLSQCFSNVVTNNIANYNGHGGVILDGENDVGSSGNIISDNILIGNTYGIKMHIHTDDNLVVNNTLSSNSAGVCIFNAANGNIITGNNAVENEAGITVGMSSSHNIISENNITNNGQGIGIGDFCNNNTVAYNVANYNNGGISLGDNSSNNLVIDNEFRHNNGTGIVMARNSCENVVKGNTIVGNDNGIEFWDNSSSNIVYHNNFVNNTEQAPSMETLNVWDNGAEGNYWSDYEGVDSNGDGIGDTVLPHLGIDNFPLVQLWSEMRTFNAYVWRGVTYQVTAHNNNTIAAFNFNHSTKQISFNVTGPAGNVGYCNITIPKALLQGNPYQVRMDEKAASNVSMTETTDETSLYFIYNLTTHRVKITGTQVLDIIPPRADAGQNRTVNEDTVITLDGSGSYDNVGIVKYTWTIFDVTLNGTSVDVTLTGMKPTFIFNTPGEYTATLNVTDAVGNWNVSSVLVTVLDITPPNANAGQNQTVLQGTAVAFDASKSSDNVGIVLYSWDFGDGTSQTGVAVTHTYSNSGAYVVTLAVKDAAGNAGTAKITINVRERGIITLTPSTGFAATTIVGSKFSNNSRVTIAWDGTIIPAILNPLITDANGSFTALISVPTQTVPGVHTVNATDETGNWNTATFTVTDMSGPQGPKGDTGQQGSQGSQGPQGPSVNIRDLLILVALPTTLAMLAICLATVALLRKRSIDRDIDEKATTIVQRSKIASLVAEFGIALHAFMIGESLIFIRE